MIVQPERYVEGFAQAGADLIIVHQEAAVHLDRILQHIKQLGKKAGVALNPATPATVLDQIIEQVDLVLVMTVNPGFGGQTFIPHTLRKIRQVRQMLSERNPACEIEIDGGVEVETIGAAYEAGARVFVAGTSVFRHPAGPAALGAGADRCRGSVKRSGAGKNERGAPCGAPLSFFAPGRLTETDRRACQKVAFFTTMGRYNLKKETLVLSSA